MSRIGEIAALGTAACWTASALFFEGASKRVGALAVNFIKVCEALVLLSLFAWATRGSPLPLGAGPRAWLFLSLSGIVGFLVADYFLFNAYILIGSRLTVVFQPLTPLFAALLGFLVLGERMKATALAAMGVVVAGILVVVLSRSRPRRGEIGAGRAGPRLAGPAAKGLAFALASSFFQAGGMILSKLGLSGCDAIAGTQIRLLTAVLGFAVQAALIGQARRVFVEAPRDAAAMRSTAVGAVFGPAIGVTLSLLALQSTATGAASAIIALTPVLIIPPSVLWLKQKVGPAEIAGAAVAVGGAAMFFLL